ncbi:MAG: D-alanyl-D-alanine carboxypeptidase [Christensenellaceae bacterium]|jgi:D-alanyl-D-alanine carboxypeptidase (penicillin-binding protein 5/6)|nr:D-alanyl-D-alanine carboxypeptidase [Christensenellaceae bacterium]
MKRNRIFEISALLSFLCIAFVAVFGFSVHNKASAETETPLPVTAMLKEQSKGNDSAAADPLGDKAKGKSAYLVDYSTGKVLYSRNENARLPIASMVKIMTLLITFEAIEEGKLALDEKIIISDTAAGMGGSQMFLQKGDEYTVSDLIKGIAVVSANDASVAIGERLAGSKDEFVRKMNAKAESLGMNDTVFVNVTGLPQDGQYSTAHDVSLMFCKLLTHPLYFNYSKTYLEEYTHPDGRKNQFANTNKLLRFYKDCDGGKTGFTNAAMFCLSATAKRDNLRVIATVIGAPDSKSRFNEVSGMFDYAFTSYQSKKIIAKGEKLDEIVTIKKSKGISELIAADDLFVTTQKGNSGNYTTRFELLNGIKAPVKANETVGTLFVRDAEGNEVGQVTIVAKHDIKKQTFGDILKELFGKLTIG